jgi:hypothetical protein
VGGDRGIPQHGFRNRATLGQKWDTSAEKALLRLRIEHSFKNRWAVYAGRLRISSLPIANLPRRQSNPSKPLKLTDQLDKPTF